MRGEGIGQAEHRGELRAEQRGAENPQVRPGAGAGRGGDSGAAVVGKVALQFHHVVGEGVGIAVERAADRAGDTLVAAGRAAEAEVDAAGEQRVQGAELFGDLQRRMVGQHDAARADPDRAGRGADMRDHHCGGGGGDTLHPVMLGDPIAVVAVRLGMAGEVRSIGERL